MAGWVREDGPEPDTIYDSEFAEARLLTLRTRNSAAYKGIYALLLREGARDWMTGEESSIPSIQGYFDEHVDIHHIFPQRWCRAHTVGAERCDSIVNKTPLALLGKIREAMGKAIASDMAEEGEEPIADYEVVQQDGMTSDDLAS